MAYMRSTIYFDVNFVYGVKYRLEFIFFMWISNGCSSICRKDCLFSTELPLLCCPSMCGSISAFSIQFH